MKEEILKTEIPRENGWLYFCGTSEDRKIVVCRTKIRPKKKYQE